MMQYSSRGHHPSPPPPRGSPDSGEAAYNSFIDIAGFATTGAAASFASSPSHSTSTYGGSPPNKMDLTKTPSGSNNYFYHSNNNSFNARISMTVQEEEVDLDEDDLHGVVDWPVDEEETQQHQVDLFNRKLQLAYPPPPPPAYPPPATTTISARNQQIFRAKGKSTASGSTGTPSQSDSTSKGSRSPNTNGRKIVATGGGGGGGGGIVFESYETTTASNNVTNTAINNRPASSNDMRGNGSHRTTNTTIFDNIAEVVAARALDPTTSLSGNKYRRDFPNNDRHNILQTQRTMPTNATSPTSSLTKKTLLSSPEQTSSPQSEFRRTGMVNKLVSMFSNKQQQQHQNQNIIQPMHTSSKQPTSTSGGVQFQLPISNKLQSHPPAGGLPTLGTNPTTATTTTPSSLSNNEDYFTHHHHQSHNYPAISPARSNTQSSVTGTSGDSSSYNPTGWPGTIDKRGRTYVMESSYSEGEDSGSWASPRRGAAAVGRNNAMGNASVRNEHAPAASAVVAADYKMEDWHQGSVVDGISVYDEKDDNTWRERRHHSSETRTAADVQLRAVLGNNRFRHDHHMANMYHSPPTNNSSLEDSAIDLSGSEERVRASGRRLANAQSPSADFNSVYSFNSHNNSHSRQRTQHHQVSGPHVLSEEALRMKDSQTSPPREGGSFLFRGYRGFIDKTKDVPNLMDDLESEGGTSMGTGVYSSSGDGRRYQQHHHHRAHAMGLALPSSARGAGMNRRLSGASSSNVESASDVFDGIIQEEQFGPIEEDILDVNSGEYRMALKTENVVQPFHGEELPYSTQFNPFAASRLHQSSTIRSSQPLDFERRHGPDNRYVGPALNLSAVTRGSSDSSPHHLDYMDDEEDGLESLPDLSIYCIQPEMVRKLVRAFRKICTNQMEISSCEETMLHDFENLVDTKKAFALFEMRSRIMETDIDRGLERKGGTNVEDDIVLTPYFQAAARVRDAVIVSKAWRDGATPKDVVTAHLLTRRSAKAYYVPRPIHRIRRRGVPFHNDEPNYWFEEAKWLDDTDFMLMRCQSLGAGTMKGFEMFTIGDCQSMLLKMTSDNCTVSYFSPISQC